MIPNTPTTNRIRCSHPTAYEVEKDEATKDVPKGYPDHWYCPRCETHFPLIGDESHWIVWISTDDSRAV